MKYVTLLFLFNCFIIKAQENLDSVSIVLLEKILCKNYSLAKNAFSTKVSFNVDSTICITDRQLFKGSFLRSEYDSKKEITRIGFINEEDNSRFATWFIVEKGKITKIDYDKKYKISLCKALELVGDFKYYIIGLSISNSKWSVFICYNIEEETQRFVESEINALTGKISVKRTFDDEIFPMR